MSCVKCDGEGAYGVTELGGERWQVGDLTVESGSSYSTVLCECRDKLPPRDGDAAWWTSEQVYAVDVTLPVFNETVSIAVKAEVPVSRDNYRVHRRGNRYYPTLIDVEFPDHATLHACTARELARSLLAAAEAAERIDDADVGPCGHWAPCDCSESAPSAAAVARGGGDGTI